MSMISPNHIVARPDASADAIHPFLTTEAKLRADGYEHRAFDLSNLLRYSLVFGGTSVVLFYRPGKRFRAIDRSFLPPIREIKPRYHGDLTVKKAISLARLTSPDAFKLIERGRDPVSIEAQQRILDLCVDVDALVSRLIPEAAAVRESQRGLRRRPTAKQQLQINRSQTLAGLEDEVLHLYREGIFDQSNSLAGLKRFAEQLEIQADAFRAMAPAQSATISQEGVTRSHQNVTMKSIHRKTVNRHGISGGSNSQVDWSYDEQV